MSERRPTARDVRVLARAIAASFISLLCWGLHETTVGRIIKKVEDVLVKCGMFRLPSKRHLYQPGWEWKVFLVDVSEMEIERPKKKQKRYYSGKQKCHTLKSQLLVDWETGKIICTAVEKGKTHDFKLLKRSRLPFVRAQLCLA